MIVAAFAGDRRRLRDREPDARRFSAGVVSARWCSPRCSRVFNLRLRANIFIAGIAVTFMAYGLTALLLKGVLGQEGVFSSDRIPTFPTIDIPVIDRFPGHRPADQRPHAARLPRLSPGAGGRLLPLPDALGPARAGRRRGRGRSGDGGNQRRPRSSSRRCCSPASSAALPAPTCRSAMSRCSPSR